MRHVFDLHEPRLRALAHRMLANAQDAEEVSTSTFVRFWKTANRYRGDCSLRTYLTRITLNLARDELRRRPKRSIDPPPSQGPSELGDRIREAMPTLQQDDREVLALYYIEDWTYDEMCETLGIGYDVLRTRLVRARQRLRKAVGVNQ